jgi:tRNA A-37 threonylcarbamoyl transferase component Bud32
MSDLTERELRGSGAILELGPEHVLKRQASEKARFEHRRTEFGMRAGETTGLFRVPRIHSFDDAAGEIVFERLHGFEPLSDLLRAYPSTAFLAERAGAALAAIHSFEASEDGNAVRLHGDFGCGNILYSSARDELAIIDWAIAQWLEQPASTMFDSPSVDLATFLLPLFWRRPFSPYSIPAPEDLAGRFLASYQARCGRPFGGSLLRSELAPITRCWTVYSVRRQGAIRALLYHRSVRRLQRFIDRVELS